MGVVAVDRDEIRDFGVQRLLARRVAVSDWLAGHPAVAKAVGAQFNSAALMRPSLAIEALTLLRQEVRHPAGRLDEVTRASKLLQYAGWKRLQRIIRDDQKVRI